MLANAFVTSNLENVIVAGDLNVRVGNMQTKIAETYLNNINNISENRTSKDIIENANGKKFMDFYFC